MNVRKHSFHRNRHKSTLSESGAVKVDFHRELKNGNFEVIKKLVRELEDGPTIKADLDAVIDASATLSNLRTSILECKEKADMSSKKRRKKEYTEKGEWALQRYFDLIAFNAFVKFYYEKKVLDMAPQGMHLLKDVKTERPSQIDQCSKAATFVDWLQTQPAVAAMREECKLE